MSCNQGQGTISKTKKLHLKTIKKWHFYNFFNEKINIQVFFIDVRPGLLCTLGTISNLFNKFLSLLKTNLCHVFTSMALYNVQQWCNYAVYFFIARRLSTRRRERANLNSPVLLNGLQRRLEIENSWNLNIRNVYSLCFSTNFWGFV
jgi:hypothetical protein